MTEQWIGSVRPSCLLPPVDFICSGLNSHISHCFPIVRDGHQPNGRVLYTHHKDFPVKVIIYIYLTPT